MKLTKSTITRKGLGVVVAACCLIAVMLATNAYGAMFQPVPDQVFGMRWGTSLEDVKKVRQLEHKSTHGDFKIFLDKSFKSEELMGAMSAIYVFMDDKLGFAMFSIHCSRCAQIFVSTFIVMHGQPKINKVDPADPNLEWDSGGNTIQVGTRSFLLTVGNRKVIEMAYEVIGAGLPEKKSPEGGEPAPNILKPERGS